MTLVDGVLLASAAWSVLMGLWRGLISQLFDLAAFVIALAAAFTFGSDVAKLIDQVVALPDAYEPVIGFVATMVVVDIVVRAALRLMGHVIPEALVGAIPNRLLGVVPSLAKFLLVATLTLNALAAVPAWTGVHAAVQASRFAPIVVSTGGTMNTLIERMLGPQLTQLWEERAL